MSIQPGDVKPRWIELARIMQSLGRKQQGIARISVAVLVDADGNPLLWTEPEIVTYSPCLAGQRVIMELLADEV